MPLRVIPSRDRKLNRAVKAAELHRVHSGAVVWERGAPARAPVLVRKGHLLLTAPGGPAAPGAAVHVLGPWEMGGEEALLTDGRRRFRAIAGEGSTVQWLDTRRVLSVLGTSRVTRDAFLAAWLEDLHALGHLAVGGSARLDAEGRLASVCLHLARRWSPGDDERPTIPVRITHQTLADLAGLHRSTVTTLLNEWIYRGWLSDLDRGFAIDEPRSLQGLAGLPGG